MFVKKNITSFFYLYLAYWFYLCSLYLEIIEPLDVCYENYTCLAMRITLALGGVPCVIHASFFFRISSCQFLYLCKLQQE
jgi:hypothetical protein